VNKMEEKSSELRDVETTLNSLRTRCGLGCVQATANQFSSVQNKLQVNLERAKKVKCIHCYYIRYYCFIDTVGYIDIGSFRQKCL